MLTRYLKIATDHNHRHFTTDTFHARRSLDSVSSNNPTVCVWTSQAWTKSLVTIHAAKKVLECGPCEI